MNLGTQTRHKTRVGEAPCRWIKQYQCCIFKNNPIWPVRWGALIEKHKTSISCHPTPQLDPRTIGLLLCQRKQYGVQIAVTVWLRKESGSSTPHPTPSIFHFDLLLSIKPLHIPQTPCTAIWRKNCESFLDTWRLGREISVVLAINYLCVSNFECCFYTDTWQHTSMTAL